jgi:hypothetical protein
MAKLADGCISVVAVLAIGGLVGCGGTSRRTTSSRPYSVREVRAAFAAEGLPLRRVRLSVSGFTWLLYKHKRSKRAVVAYVFPDARATHKGRAWAHGSPPPRTLRYGNVIVQWFPYSFDRRVHAALSRLQ